MSKKNAAGGVSPFAHLLSSAAAAIGLKAATADSNGAPDFGEPDAPKPEGEPATDQPSAPATQTEGEGDEEEQEEAEDQPGETAADARVAERARCRAIFAATSAGVRPDMAAMYAFDSDVTAAEAVRFLDAAAAGHQPTKAGGLRERMSGVTPPNPGADGGKSQAGLSEDQVFAQNAKAVAEKLGR